MDSLLWHIASVAEAQHIVHDTEQNRLDYERKIAEIERQIKSIVTQKQNLSIKRERLFDGWVDGKCTEEKYRRKESEFNSEERRLDEEMADCNRQVEQLKHLIADLSSTWKRFNMGTPAYHLYEIGELISKIRETTDDAIRSEIIHKHIIKAFVFDEGAIEYKFAKRQKETRMKRIEVHKYQGDTVSYYFLPFAGKKCMFWDNPQQNPDSLVDMEYLHRYKDKYKKKLVRKTDEYKEYYRVATLSEKTGLSTYIIRKALREGHLHSTYKCGTYFISEADANAFLKSLHSKRNNYIEAKEAAQQLGVDIREVWALLRKGEIPAHKDGHHYNIPIAQFEAYRKRIGK